MFLIEVMTETVKDDYRKVVKLSTDKRILKVVFQLEESLPESTKLINFSSHTNW